MPFRFGGNNIMIGAAFMYSGLLLVFIVPIVLMVLGIRHAIMKRKWIDEAIEKGCVVIADFVSFHDGDIGDVDSRSRDSSEYRYEVNGETYKYTYKFETSNPPEKLTLYYRKNPKYAQAEKEVGFSLRDRITAIIKVWLVVFLLLCFANV